MAANTVITGTGSVIPELVVPNSAFLNNEFYDKSGSRLDRSNEAIISKLEEITGIRERRYVPFDQDSIGLMTEASQLAIADAGIGVKDLSGIIVAHNAGNMVPDTGAFHTVPNLAAALKHELSDTDHNCFAYDLLFGCPGWLQGIVQAHQAIQCGDAEHVLITGLEIASRMLDPHDVDSMILADGCGACVVSRNVSESSGIISHATYSHGQDDNRMIYLGASNKPGVEGSCYFHMNGREVYKYATKWVPLVIKDALERAKTSIADVGMFLFHQANAKMLCSITKNLAELCSVSEDSFTGRVPTTIELLGNTSVATIPTMLDMILKRQLEGYRINPGDTAVMASVGAGMHCNAIVYEF